MTTADARGGDTITVPQTWGKGLDWVFVDGSFVPAEDARVSAYAHILSYGTGTFEGIRAFWNDDHRQLYLLEPRAHFERMGRSANVLGLALPYGVEKLVELSAELLRRNEVRFDAYVRPLLVLAGEELPVRMHDIQPRFSLAASSLSGDYLADRGLRCMVSSWRRAPDLVAPGRAKLCGSYVGPALAKSDAVHRGFDDAIMLNVGDHVAEATTANLFLRRGSTWITPGGDQDILEGITRREVMELLAERTGAPVVERAVQRSELYVCDELFLCGTAAQVVPVVEVDERPVADGQIGATTSELAAEIRAISLRQGQRHHDWTHPVYATEEKS